jgi:hypothetical protein
MEFLDIFNDDAFSLVSMVAAINKLDYIPGRAGELVFAGTAEGIATTTAVFEKKSQALSLIQTSVRGAPAPQETEDKGSLLTINVPQVKKEQTIGAHQVQGVREFGSTNVLRSVQSVVNQQMVKLQRQFDLTLEHLRLGALKGHVRDADGTLILDLFSSFSISGDEAELSDIDFTLDTSTTDVRGVCSNVIRTMRRNLKAVLPSTAQVWAFCGDVFFDKLISHTNVKAAYQNYVGAGDRLGGSYINRIFPFGGINFENYAGTDDQTSTSGGTVGIHPNECQFFLTGVPGLYQEFYAPADFFDTVNTIGLPRYARIAPDDEMQRYVKLHVQMNPLPVCTRPRTLIRGVANAADTSDFPQSAT